MVELVFFILSYGGGGKRCVRPVPFFKKKINIVLSKIPYKVQSIVLHICLVIFFVDMVMSFIRYLP